MAKPSAYPSVDELVQPFRELTAPHPALVTEDRIGTSAGRCPRRPRRR
ncbi:hypothetical protein [Streptomyces sp. AC512_CC834]|nr:hypothetical protein [Streptomyces sp. AC512_CC834]